MLSINCTSRRTLFIENVGNPVCPASFDLGQWFDGLRQKASGQRERAYGTILRPAVQPDGTRLHAETAPRFFKA